MFVSVNPVTQEVLFSQRSHNDSEIKSIISQSEKLFHFYRFEEVSSRCRALLRFKLELQENLEKISTTITLEMGKPILQSRAEIQKSIDLCQFYLDQSPLMLEPEFISLESKLVELRYDPLGPVLGIMPWNFPVWQCLRFAIPAIMSGNTVLLKPAPNTAMSTLLLEPIFERSFGFKVFSVLLAEIDSVKKIISNKIIRGVSLTGSVYAGSKVAELAGKNIKKSVLELGGSDPFIVFHDTDLEKAARCAVLSRMNNSGQTCLAAKRILVQRNVYRKFVGILEHQISSLKVGDPFDESTNISTLAKSEIRNTLQLQLDQALAKGAKAIVEGGSVPGTAYFFKPAMLEGIRNDMHVYNQEVFGPLCIVMPFDDHIEAVKIANDSRYGLGASIWTDDTDIQEYFMKNLEAGFISVNDYVRSDPRIPFGGIKDSGFGRELGVSGIREFTNLKSIIRS